MTDAAWRPAPSRVVDTAEAIKALADPLRLRLLQLLMGDSGRSWSVKEMAAALGQPVTKLYHHLKLLEAAALITDVESRLVSGIVEHRYRTSQRSLRFDDSLFMSAETRDDTIAQVSALVDTSRDALVDYLHQEYADADEVVVSKATARLTATEIAAVVAMVDELVASFVAAREDDRRTGPRSSMLVLLHPLADAQD